MTTTEGVEMKIHLRIVGSIVLLLSVARGRYDRGSERGDVPGWVMVTVMTAGLVAAIWALAGPELERMLRDALRSVA
jgi:hypothetical protein